MTNAPTKAAALEGKMSMLLDDIRAAEMHGADLHQAVDLMRRASRLRRAWEAEATSVRDSVGTCGRFQLAQINEISKREDRCWQLWTRADWLRQAAVGRSGIELTA